MQIQNSLRRSYGVAALQGGVRSRAHTEDVSRDEVRQDFVLQAKGLPLDPESGGKMSTGFFKKICDELY